MEQKIVFDHTEIKARLVQLGYSRERFADELGISRIAVDNFINGKSHWSDKKIYKAKEMLGIADRDMKRFFFTPKK